MAYIPFRKLTGLTKEEITKMFKFAELKDTRIYQEIKEEICEELEEQIREKSKFTRRSFAKSKTVLEKKCAKRLVKKFTH
jgi:predicted transposase YdaD